MIDLLLATAAVIIGLLWISASFRLFHAELYRSGIRALTVGLGLGVLAVVLMILLFWFPR